MDEFRFRSKKNRVERNIFMRKYKTNNCISSNNYSHNKDYSDADQEESYAYELSSTLDKYFQEGKLKEAYTDFEISICPKRYLRQETLTKDQRRSYKVRIVMFYSDVISCQFIDWRIQETYLSGSGSGAAYADSPDDLMIVMNGDSVELCDEEYFKTTFIHEIMHILDSCSYRYFFSKESSYGKRTKHEIKRNSSIPYPTVADNLFDEKFSEYFTCENEIREYRHDLKSAVVYCSEVTEYDVCSILDEIISSCEDQERFIDHICCLPSGVNIAPFMMIYHMCFSNPSHGDKNTAIKILKGIKNSLLLN